MITLLESGPQPTALGKRVLDRLCIQCALVLVRPLLAVLRCNAEPKPYGEFGSKLLVAGRLDRRGKHTRKRQVGNGGGTRQVSNQLSPVITPSTSGDRVPEAGMVCWAVSHQWPSDARMAYICRCCGNVSLSVRSADDKELAVECFAKGASDLFARAGLGKHPTSPTGLPRRKGHIPVS